MEYLGPMEGAEVEHEAASWCAFLHPMFCFARGCSTKLATGLGWQIPCLSTESGVRGYDLPSGAVVMAVGPQEFALQACKLANQAVAKETQARVVDSQKEQIRTEAVTRLFQKIVTR